MQSAARRRGVCFRRSVRWACLAMGLGFGGILTGPVHAGDSGDHDRARQALEAGEILPLKTVLEKLVRDNPGQVMEVDLERRGERWVYEIKLLRPGGALSKLLVDARDGAVIGNRER